MQYQDFIIKEKSVELINLADIHLGHRNCDKNILSHTLTYIENHKCLWIGGGDYGDAIIPNDPRFDINSIDKNFLAPKQQYDKITELFKPIRKKCLVLLEGNHDYYLWKRNQNSLISLYGEEEGKHGFVYNMAKDLGVLYGTIDSYIRLHFEKFDVDFDIYAHHGWTGARTAGARVARIYDLYNVFPMLDLYIMNHIHALSMAEPKTSLFINNGEIRDKISRFMYGGSYLRGYQLGTMSYVEEKTYTPTTLGSPKLTITAKEGKNGLNFDIAFHEIR